MRGYAALSLRLEELVLNRLPQETVMQGLPLESVTYELLRAGDTRTACGDGIGKRDWLVLFRV